MSALAYVRRREYMIKKWRPLAFCTDITNRAFKYRPVYRDEYLALAKRVCDRYSRQNNTFGAMCSHAGHGRFINGEWEVMDYKTSTNPVLFDNPYCTMFGNERNHEYKTDLPYSLFWGDRQTFNVPKTALFCDCCGKYGNSRTIKYRSDISNWERCIDRTVQCYAYSKNTTCQSCYNKIKGLVHRMDEYNKTKKALTKLIVETQHGQNQNNRAVA